VFRKAFTYLFAVFISLSSILLPQNRELMALGQEALDWAKKNLPQQGVLEEDDEGSINLKVDPRYTDDLYERFVPFGYKKPAYPFGAHITVIHYLERKSIPKVDELGQTYTFKLYAFKQIRLAYRDFVVLRVKAPELEKLREKYGLTPLRDGNPLHISIAEKYIHSKK